MSTLTPPPRATPPSQTPRESFLPPEPPAPIIAREGWPIVAIFALVTAILGVGITWLAGWPGYVAGGIGSVLTLWCIWFFRDPLRRTPAMPGAVISPADGVVCQVTPAKPPPDLGLSDETTTGMTRIAIFMNVFNVHVNRSPEAATVAKISYRPGKFLTASLDKASEDNERCGLVLRTAEGVLLPCVQIAGLVARRIVCKVKEGDSLRRGQRYGLIRFGSRVDVYIPAGASPRVTVGERTVAGETILAVLNAPKS